MLSPKHNTAIRPMNEIIRAPGVTILKYLHVYVHGGYHGHDADDEQHNVLQYGSEIVAALEREVARCAEHFDDADDAEEEEHCPYHSVTLKFAGCGFFFHVCLLILLFAIVDEEAVRHCLA